MHNRTAGARRATAKSAYPSVASLPSPRRFASACRGLRPLKNAWPTASDVYQGRGKPRRRQPNHLELNQTYAPPEGSLRVGQYGSRRSDRLCSSWTTAAACKSVRVERQRGGGSAATGAASEPPESPTQRGSCQSGGKPTLAPETRPGGRRGPILAAATVQPWPGLAGPSGAAFDQGGPATVRRAWRGRLHRHHHLRPLRRRGTDRRQHRGTHRHPRHPRPLREARRAGASALPARSARAAAGRVTRCRPHSRQPSQSPIRCGHDPAGLRSALCRDSVRNGYALSRCVAPRCRKPTHEPPICARSVPKAALARPPPTRQTRQKGG